MGLNLQLVKDTFRQKSFEIAFFDTTQNKFAFKRKMLLIFWFE